MTKLMTNTEIKSLIVELKKSGMKPADIARHVNKNEVFVFRALKAAGLSTRKVTQSEMKDAQIRADWYLRDLELKEYSIALKTIEHLGDTVDVTSDGRVWSHRRNCFLTQTPNDGGYLTVKLRERNEYVHRLVALAFIPNPDNLETVDHKVANKFNNNVTNLQWMTRKDNSSKGNREG